MNDNIDGGKFLFKIDEDKKKDENFRTSISIIENGRVYIEKICKSLLKEKYNPQDTVDCICFYLDNQRELDRILYSEMSRYLFALEDNRRSIISSNFDRLLNFVFEKDFDTVVSDYGKKKTCREIIVKMYDHFELVWTQKEIMDKKAYLMASKMYEKLHDENKKMEKEYVAILAIFASIVVAFMGGVSFSERVLESVNKASIYRLVFVINGLGCILFNLIYMMIKLIFEITDKKIEGFQLVYWNNVFLIIALLVIVARLLNVHCLGEFYALEQIWAH